MTADHHPRPSPTDPAPTDHVTAREINNYLRHLDRTRPPARGGDAADYAALLAHKADLFTRIANQNALTDPTRAQQARRIAEHAQAAAARHADEANTHDTTNVKHLASPSSPRQGISLSNTAEFRRAPSPLPSAS
jgi:hypothetical protein